MKAFLRAGIKSKFILLVVLAVLPVVLLMFFNSWYHRKSHVEEAVKRIEKILSFAVLHEEGTIREAHRILAMLAEVSIVRKGGHHANEYLARVLKASPGYTNFGVIRPDGQVIASAIPLKEPPNVSDRPYFQDALKNRSFSIGSYQIGRTSGKPSVPFGYPVLDRQGKVIAVLFAGIDLSLATKFEAEVEVQTPQNSPYVKLDLNGSVLTSFPEAQVFGRGHPLEKSLFKKISTEKTGTFIATGMDGVERLYVFSPLRGPLNKEGGYALLGIPTKSLFAEANDLFFTNIAVLSVVGVFFLTIVWFGGNALIIRPVHILTGEAKRLAAGDLTARSGLSSTLGELGQLGQTFDEMAGNIERGIQERREAEKRISKGLKMLTALRKVDRNILCGANVRETLELVCETILEMGYRLCWVGMAERDYSVRVSAVRGVEEEAFADLDIRWDDTPQGGGPSGTVIKTGQSYVSQNILENIRFAPWRDKVIEWGLRSLVSLPLKSDKGDVIGALHVYSDQENRFTTEDISDLETFAQQCVVALLSAKNIEDLRDANQRLTFHVNRMPLAYIVWDKEFRVVEWNPAAERIFGWRAEEALGKHPYGFIVPAEAKPHVDRVWSKLLEGDESSYSLNANTRKDGKTITCEWFNTPMRNALGSVTGVLSMVHDVTEKTSLERQLQTAQRMEAVGTLAGGIAHDFNNALTGIFGFGEILKSQLAENERALSDLNEIMRCADRAATLTRQLLTYSRRQIIDPVNLNLNKVLTDLLKLVSKVVGEHIEIRTFLAKDLPTIRADVGQVEQVVMNLVLNARDAMPDGGHLLIETGLVNLDAEYVRCHPYMRVGSYVLLAVSDTGVGMDQKTQERVFEPFFTTKGPDKGTGLGLAMVYGVVRQHNGFIHLYSEPGKGTILKIYFPPVDAAPDVIKSQEPLEIRRGAETILLAEDDESVRMLAERTLKELGYTVLAARNGEDAVTLFMENRARISLALLDVVMPLKGGKEAYEAMYRQEPGLKVIFMSGYTANAVHESFVLIAGVPFLAKPFGPEALARKVREVLDKA